MRNIFLLFTKELVFHGIKFPLKLLTIVVFLFVKRLFERCLDYLVSSILSIVESVLFYCLFERCLYYYSRLSITRTRTGNWKPFELWRVRVIESNYRGHLTEGTEKSVRVMEVSGYRGSNYRESTLYLYGYFRVFIIKL